METSCGSPSYPCRPPCGARVGYWLLLILRLCTFFSSAWREGEQPASQNCLQTLFEEAKDTLVLLAQPILSDTSITEPQDWFSFMLTWHLHIRCMMSSNDDNCSFQDCHQMRCFRILASSDGHFLELVPCDVREGIRWFFCVVPLIAEHHTALIANKLGCTIGGINQANFTYIQELFQIFQVDTTKVWIIQENWYLDFSRSFTETINLLGLTITRQTIEPTGTHKVTSHSHRQQVFFRSQLCQGSWGQKMITVP